MRGLDLKTWLCLSIGDWPAILLPAVIIGIVVLPGHGVIYMRDPAFFATTRMNVLSRLQPVSVDGDVFNQSTQAIFYTPFAVVEAILSGVHVGAGLQSKLFVLAFCLIGTSGIVNFGRSRGWGLATLVLASALFLLNPRSLDQFGFFFEWTGFCLMPWILLAVSNIDRSAKYRLVLMICLVFSGGLVAWVISLIVVAIAVIARYHSNVERRRKVFVDVFVICLLSSLFWTLPYLFWIFRSVTAKNFASFDSSVLLGPHPVVGAFTMRDFWWPHLSVYSGGGPLVVGLSDVVALVLSLGALVWWFGLLRQKPRSISSSAISRSMSTAVFALLVLGLLLAWGPLGPTGWAYRVFYDAPLPLHQFVDGLLRTPSDFLGLFIFGVVVFVGDICAGGSFSLRGRYLTILCLGLAIFLLCAPSVDAFNAQYRPLAAPSYYSELAGHIAKGTVLEIGDWPAAAITPHGGVARFDWSSRMVADPTLLQSYVSQPNLSPASSDVHSLNSRIIAELDSNNVGLVMRQLDDLGIHVLLFQNDVIRVEGVSLRHLADLFSSVGGKQIQIGGITEVLLDNPVRDIAWSRSCSVRAGGEWLGLLYVHCHSPGRHVVYSTFNMLGPAIGVGIDARLGGPIYAAVGSSIVITGHRGGWVFSVAALANIVGFISSAVGLCVFVLRWLLARSMIDKSQGGVTIAP